MWNRSICRKIEFALKFTTGLYSRSLLPSSADQATIGLCSSEFFFVFSFLYKHRPKYYIIMVHGTNAKPSRHTSQMSSISVAGDSDDSDVVAGDASYIYVSSSSLLLLLSIYSPVGRVHVGTQWKRSLPSRLLLLFLLPPPISAQLTFNSLVFHSRVFCAPVHPRRRQVPGKRKSRSSRIFGKLLAKEHAKNDKPFLADTSLTKAVFTLRTTSDDVVRCRAQCQHRLNLPPPQHRPIYETSTTV